MTKKRKSKPLARYMDIQELADVIARFADGNSPQFGKLIGVHRRTINGYLSGEHRVPLYLTILLRLLASGKLHKSNLRAEIEKVRS